MSDEPETKTTRKMGDEARAASRLTVDAVKRLTTVVEQMHQAIGGGPGGLARPLVTLFSAPVYASIRGVTELVGVGLDRALEQLEPVLGDRTPSEQYDAVRAALNGVLGDQLAEAHSPLAIEMSWRLARQTLVLERAAVSAAVPTPGGRVLVLVHGSSMDDAAWTRRGHDHGAALARDLGFTPLTVRYNSGLHVSTNGRQLAHQLQALVEAWPHPLEALVVVGFSMGGLVARAAVHSAEDEGLGWRQQLSALAFLGTPHHGAPLERIGNVLGMLLDLHAYAAPLGELARIRSAGVTDLRHGNVRDAHWADRDRFAHGPDPRGEVALPAGVPCFAIAATGSAAAPGAPADLGGLASDGLVPVTSALGRHEDGARALAFPLTHQHVVPRHQHLDLLSSAEAYEKLRGWLAGVVR